MENQPFGPGTLNTQFLIDVWWNDHVPMAAPSYGPMIQGEPAIFLPTAPPPKSLPVPKVITPPPKVPWELQPSKSSKAETPRPSSKKSAPAPGPVIRPRKAVPVQFRKYRNTLCRLNLKLCHLRDLRGRSGASSTFLNRHAARCFALFCQHRRSNQVPSHLWAFWIQKSQMWIQFFVSSWSWFCSVFVGHEVLADLWNRPSPFSFCWGFFLM